MAAPRLAVAIDPTLKTQPLTAVGISRVSLLIQVDNYSIDGQKAQIRILEKKYGFTIPEGFLLDDEGYSGTNMNRPAIKRALRMVKAGEVNAVVFPYLDRFSRNVEFGLTMIRLFREAGAQVLFGEIGWVDDTPMCKMLINNLLMMAEMQRDQIAYKSRDGVRTKIAKGLAFGGRSPFGWHFVTALEIAAEALNKGLEVPPGKPQNIHKPVPADIGTLRLIGQLVLAGASAKGLCRIMLARGIKSPKGKVRWNPTTMSKLVHDPFYSTGIWYYGKRESIRPKKRRNAKTQARDPKNGWRLRPQKEWQPQRVTDTPVWTPEEQKAIIEALERNRKTQVGKRAGEDGLEALLKSLMVCKRKLASGEVCDKAIVPKQVSSPSGRRGYYHCSNRDRVFNGYNCNGRCYRFQDVEQPVLDATKKALTEDLDRLVAEYRDDICATVDPGELERLKADEQRWKRTKEEARERELYADDADDKRYYAGQLSEAKAQLAMIRRRIMSATEEIDAVVVDTAAIREEVRDAWKTKVRSELREFLVGWIRPGGIEWLNDEELRITLNIPLRCANGQPEIGHVDHYIPLKIKAKVAA